MWRVLWLLATSDPITDACPIRSTLSRLNGGTRLLPPRPLSIDCNNHVIMVVGVQFAQLRPLQCTQLPHLTVILEQCY
jgi:hypothetical protein